MKILVSLKEGNLEKPLKSLTYTLKDREDIAQTLEYFSLYLTEDSPEFSDYKKELKYFFMDIKKPSIISVSNFKSKGWLIREKEISFSIPFLLKKLGKSGKPTLEGVFYYRITEKK